MSRITTLVIHHSAGGRDTTSLEDIRRMHTDPDRKPYPLRDVAYHYVVEGSGCLRVGRDLSEKGAHAPPNTGRIGICLTGDNTVPGELWSAEQIATLHHVINAMRLLWPNIRVEGHRDLMRPGYTECPGLDVAGLFG